MKPSVMDIVKKMNAEDSDYWFYTLKQAINVH